MENIEDHIINLKLGKKTTVKYQGVKLSILKGDKNLFLKAKPPTMVKVLSAILLLTVVLFLASLIPYTYSVKNTTPYAIHLTKANSQTYSETITIHDTGAYLIGNYFFISIPLIIIISFSLSSFVYQILHNEKIKNFEKEYSSILKNET